MDPSHTGITGYENEHHFANKLNYKVTIKEKCMQTKILSPCINPGVTITLNVSSTLWRLRSGHYLAMEHLPRLRMKNCPNCRFRKRQHIFSSCILQSESINLFIEYLDIPQGFKKPLSKYDIIFKTLNKNIIHFSSNCNLKL